MKEKGPIQIVRYWNEELHGTVFSIPNYSFEGLFRINAQIMVDIFIALLEERQVIMVMRDIKESAVIM